MTTTSKWLDVEVSDDIELDTLPSNIALVDVNNDREVKLVVGDLGRGEEPKVKIFRGATQVADIILPDIPLSVVGFYATESVPHSAPFIAVAFSTCVYVYKNLKVYCKYFLPSVELNSNEIGIWKQLIDPKNHLPDIISSLAANLATISHEFLSPQSLKFINLTPEEQLDFLEESPNLPIKSNTEITCMATLKMRSVDQYAISCLVIGTEDGDIIFLDPHTFGAMHKTRLSDAPRTPHLLLATGLYAVDYRLVVATRDKSVCVVRRDGGPGRALFTADDHVVSMQLMPPDGSILIVCADNTMSCYSKKGKKQWCVPLAQRARAAAAVRVRPLGAALLAVALASGHLRLYAGRALVDTLFVRDAVSVVKFGQLGQEEHVLIIITTTGHLQLKILKRTAEFGTVAAAAAAETGAPPWLLPKKSKLFLEQSVRERDNAVAMHASFQASLPWLRLAAAARLLEAHTRGDNARAAGPLEPLRLHAEVEGMGPTFLVTLVVRNEAAAAVRGLALLLHARGDVYATATPLIKIPLLAPASSARVSARVRERSAGAGAAAALRASAGAAADLKILLLKEGRARPVLAAALAMPATDPVCLPPDQLGTFA